MPTTVTTPILSVSDIIPGQNDFYYQEVNTATSGHAMNWGVRVFSNPGDLSETTIHFGCGVSAFDLAGGGWIEVWKYMKQPNETVLSPQGTATDEEKIASWQAILDSVADQADMIMSA